MKNLIHLNFRRIFARPQIKSTKIIPTTLKTNYGKTKLILLQIKKSKH